MLHGNDVLYLVEERAPRRPSLVSDVGVRLPAHLTASGLAMLAALPAAQVRALYPSATALVRRHDSGPTSLRQLRALLTGARARGYAVEQGTVTPGFASVAAAVLDRAGYRAAAFAVTYESADQKADQKADEGVDDETRLAAAVTAAATTLSRRILGTRMTS